MSDLIDRQVAIDALLAVTGNSSVRELYEHVQEHGLSDMWSGGVNAAIDVIIAQPSAQPDLQQTCNQLATDCISRQAAIDAIHKEWDGCINVDESGKTIAYETEDVICRLPSAQPTLYGYNIEHLAYIARVMEKEGITAEVAVNTFLDVGHAVKMILDEAREIAEREIFK